MGRAYKQEPWADLLWKMHREDSPGETDGDREFGEDWEDFSADIFNRLYSNDMVEPEALDEAPSWVQRVHEELENVSLWQDLRRKVQGAEPRWAIATQAAEELLEGLFNIAKGYNSSLDEPHETREKLRVVLRCTEDAVEDLEEGLGVILTLFSGSSSEMSEDRVDMGQVQEAVKLLQSSRELAALLQMAGRMFQAARKRAGEKVDASCGELHGTGPGRDISRLVPSEMLNLLDEDTYTDLLFRLEDGQAQCYTLRRREPKKKGRIVCLLDCSISMEWEGGHKWKWSKAACLALLMQAEREKREVHILIFNGGIQLDMLVKPGNMEVEQLQQFLRAAPSGGTNFDVPLQMAISSIRSGPDGDADIVMITDGEAVVSDVTQALCKVATESLGVALYVVGVGSSAARTCAGSLGSLAEQILVIKNTGDVETVAGIILGERRAA